MYPEFIPGFEVITNINNIPVFANEFPVSGRELDDFTVRIIDFDGKPFINNKGNANFIIILSYDETEASSFFPYKIWKLAMYAMSKEKAKSP